VQGSIGSRISEARKIKGWTQAQLAKQAGLSTNTVNRFEKGHRVPDANQIIQLAEALSCAPERLLLGGGTGRRTDLIGIAVKDDQNPGGLAEDENDGFGRLLVPGVNDGDQAFIVSNESMAPLFAIGDYVVIKKELFKTGDMVAFLDQWRNMNFRWLREKDKQKFLVAENAEYPAIALSEKEEIIGRVIAVVKVSRFD
jgi:transcriptional regulator with XRE-family HTH domain